MGKNNVNKRFTVDLEISTGDAEKQVKASAENIKKILSSAIEDGIGTKELRKMAETINAMFTGLGKTAPLNIDENFTGKGKTAERVKILSNELNNLFDILGKINTTSSTSGNVLGGVNNEAQAEIDKLEEQSRRYQSIIDTFNQVSKMKIAWDDGDKIELDIEATEESAKKLIDRFNQLNDVINEGNLDDITYADALANRAKAALQLIEINERLTKTNKNGEVIKESPKFLRDFLAMNDDGESLSQYALEDFEYEAPEIISKLKNSVSEVTQQMENLRNTTETALSGVDSIAKGSSIGNKVDDIGKAAESSKEKVDALKNSIKEAFMSSAQIEVDTRSGKLNGNETMSLFEANGNVSTVQGTGYQVDTDALVQQAIANLNKNIVMSLHNHANGDMTFSPSDINSFAKLYYGQGTKINGIIANGVIQTIDFNNISQEVAVKIAKDYQEGVKHFFDSELVSQFASLQGGEIIPTDMLKRLQINDPKQYQEVINTIQDGTMAILRQAFENNGAEFALQSFDVDNIEKLTEYLHKAQQSAQGTIEPVEKLKNLITTLNPNKTFDWNQFTDIFEKFKSGAIDGTQAFNQILGFKTVAADVSTATVSIEQAEAKLKEFLVLTEEIRTKNFDYYGNAEDNVEVGKYTERLTTAKAALDELGDQGLLTAEQLNQAQEAFNRANSNLNLSTSHYSGYGDGNYAYSYYDEYQNELEKKESLQAENEQLKAQLADQEANRQQAQRAVLSQETNDLDAENASLERKLELLQDIAEQYGNSITQKDRNRYEKLSDKEMESGLTSEEEDRYSELGEKISEADEQLEQFGETYDKILLKLANGKTIEILPDDAGLRKFDKIANEFYQGEYNGFEIEDVIFMRKQEQSVIEQNNQELQKQLDIQEQIATAQKETPEPQQAETIANNAKAITSWEELCQVVERYNELVLKANTEGQTLTNEDEAELSRINDRFAATKGIADDPNKFVDYTMAMSRMSGILGEYNPNKLAEYFGIEIPQAAAKATDAIQEVAQATEDSFTPPDTSASTAKYEAEIQVIKQQNDELERNQQLKVQEGALDTNSSVVGGVSQESKQLDELHVKLIAVKEAVDAKTQAFEEEYVTADAAVNAEVQALQLLLQQLQDVLNTIGLINQAFTQANESIAQLYGAKDINIKEDVTSNAAIEKSKEIIDKQYALDSTVASTNKILGDILAAINKEKDPGVQKELGTLVSALTANINALKDATNGIIDHQKVQKTNLSTASSRIANNYDELISQANVATTKLGSDMRIKQMKPLADGIVEIEGAVKNADGVWNGFIANINESNQTILTAVGTQLSYAKSLNKSADAAKENSNAAQKQDTFTGKLATQKTDFAQYKQDVENATGVTDELKGKLVELENQLNSVGDADGLAKWVQSFKNVVNEIKSSRGKIATEIIGKANSKFREVDFKADSNNLTSEQQAIVDKREELLRQISEYNAKVNSSQKAEISGIEATRDALYNLIDAYKKKYNIENAGGSATKKAYGTAQLQNFTGKYNDLMNRASNVELNSDFEAVRKLTAAYQRLKDVQAKFKVGEDTKFGVGAQRAEEFKQAQIECNRYAQELAKIITAEEKLRTNSNSTGGKSAPVAEDFEDSNKGRAQALKDFVSVAYGASASIGKLNDDMTELSFVVKNSDGTITNMTASLNAARTAIYATAGGTEKATTSFGRFFDELKAKARGITTYLISMTGFQEIWQQVRQGVQYVREIDSALTELKKVTDETDATYSRFLQTASKTAGIIGSNVADFTNATADFARLGYNLEEAANLAKTASIYKNVGDGIENISQASESIISTMKAFGIEANNAMGIVDRFNAVGNSFAISSTGIGEAMQRSASALSEAGNTIDESIALITGANSVVQNPEQVGKMLADYKVA